MADIGTTSPGFRCLLVALVVSGSGAAWAQTVEAPPATPVTTIAPSVFAELDTTTLTRLLKERGFAPKRKFKALVIRIRPVKGPDGATTGWRYEPYDHAGSSRHWKRWWPASAVKIFAAVAALQKTRELGFSPRAKATYHYPPRVVVPGEEPPRRDPNDGPVTVSVERLVRKALIPSDNLAFDRLVELVGFDEINRRFFSRRHGFRRTVLLRSYAHRVVDPETERGIFGHSPPILLREDKRRKRLRERHARRTYRCPDQGNCTSLRELAETMRRVMMHEHLPEDERFALGPEELALLREALSTKRPRGNGVVDNLRAGFGEAGASLQLYHKPGYALRWFSDNVFVYRPDTDERWLVAMANHPGRDSCDEAARHIGALLAEGRL